jgi:hypothetical protein
MDPHSCVPGRGSEQSLLLNLRAEVSTPNLHHAVHLSNGALMVHLWPNSPATQLSNSGATRSTQYSNATRCYLLASTPPSTASLTFAASPASASPSAWLHRPMLGGSGRLSKK